MKIKTILLTLFATLISISCTEVTQTIEPSPVEVTVTQPGAPEEPDQTPTTPGVSGTITLEPATFEVTVSKNVNVKVIVKDSNGKEIPSENISVSILDPTVLELVEIDNRILTFGGVSPGVTSVIITATGLQTSLVATVTP